LVQVELAGDLEKRLEDAAAARGLKPEVLAVQLIDSVLPEPAEKGITREQMQQFLERMAAHSDKIPILPDHAFTRESFYEDHD
jgi:hypothetical protein